MRITKRRTRPTAKIQRPARAIAVSMAALFITGAMWSLMPAHDVGQAAPGATHAGHMLIPSGVPDQAGRKIDRAIVREKGAATPGERDAPRTAVDAIYRIERAAGPRRGDRIMT